MVYAILTLSLPETNADYYEAISDGRSNGTLLEKQAVPFQFFRILVRKANKNHVLFIITFRFCL